MKTLSIVFTIASLCIFSMTGFTQPQAQENENTSRAFAQDISSEEAISAWGTAFHAFIFPARRRPIGFSSILSEGAVLLLSSDKNIIRVFVPLEEGFDKTPTSYFHWSQDTWLRTNGLSHDDSTGSYFGMLAGISVTANSQWAFRDGEEGIVFLIKKE